MSKCSAFISNYKLDTFFILLSLINCVSARRYPEDGYFSRSFFDEREQYAKVDAALGKIVHSPKLVSDWPDPSVIMGQVSGVAIDSSGQIHVFHRASNVWDASTFSIRNVYQGIGEIPITSPTVLVFNNTGELVDLWGENLFYMPHGITVDASGNVWLTDVALHQVFKFTPDNRKEPALKLGEKFVPGDDDDHFCKPSSVAVHSSGDFFVADGYCNTRIIKYKADGTKILQWGRRTGQTPFTLNVPHALTIAEDKNAVCTADRERGRIACFRADNGTYIHSYSHWLIGRRLFSVAYSPIQGGRLYLVNGPALTGIPVRGYVIEYTSGRLIQTFAPGDSFRNPHDVAVSPDGSTVYVAELDPHKVYKFLDESLLLKNETVGNDVTTEVLPAKPTATVEVSGVSVSSGWEWGGAAGGALGAGGAALLALAAVALLNARNRGKRYDESDVYADK